MDEVGEKKRERDGVEEKKGRERKAERERHTESNRLPIFQSHLTCPVLWALLGSGAGGWEAGMHTHAPKKKGGGDMRVPTLVS